MGPIHLGPIDMSINKAVVYLWVGRPGHVLLGIWIMRFGLRSGRAAPDDGREPLRAVQSQIAEGNLPSKAMQRLVSLRRFALSLHLDPEHGWVHPASDLEREFPSCSASELPTWGIYAATANLSVTLALALITFVATHVEGIRYNGVVRYFKSWIPAGVPKALLGPIVSLEVISQFMRLISLSVRLFANMLAGHMLILVMLGLIFIF